MPMPTLVMFDLDGVLCTFNTHVRAEYLARLTGSTPEDIYAAIWGSGFDAQADAGEIDPSAYLHGYGERIGYPITLREWLDARKFSMKPNTEVLDLVKRIRDRTHLAVLTNNTALVADNIDYLFPELVPLFGTRIFCSASLEATKPSVECYWRCLAALDVSPADSLFVDDSPANVDGARRAGLSAHLYASPAGLAWTFRNHGLLQSRGN